MRRLIVVFSIAIILLLSVLSCTPTSQSPSYTPPPAPSTPAPIPAPVPALTPVTGERTQATVVRVIDGDTIEVNIGGRLYRVRYIGMDTLERGQVGYEEATLANAQLVSNRIVGLEKDVSETDRYGRLLRYVWVEESMVNAILVASGYAQVATYPPDVKYQNEFLELQRQARESGLGLWSTAKEPTPAPTPTPTKEVNVQITLIFYDGRVPYVESDEYVEVKNLGSEPVNLAGWVLKDISEGYPLLTFPSYILKPGESIRVYTNETHPEHGGFSFGYGKAVWNNSDPDTAALYNAQGQEVSRKSY